MTITEFEKLAAEWKHQTKFYSSATQMAQHSAYRKIIAAGWEVVPLILNDLIQKPDHWFIALAEITGENPVPEESRGKLGKMADAWIKWGIGQGLLE